MHRKTPEIEMEALLKRYYTKVQYFVGTVMNVADLHRIQVDLTSATVQKKAFESLLMLGGKSDGVFNHRR
jgi:hypothetical protein